MKCNNDCTAQHSTAQHSTAQQTPANVVVDNSPLFRPEVTASLSQQWMGAIRLAQPISSWLIAAVAALIACAFIAYIVLGSVTKKARVTGITIPIAGSLSIAATSAGILNRTFVKEGDHVKAGQTLFEISTERHNQQGEISHLVAQQMAARQSSLEAELRSRQQFAQEEQQELLHKKQNLDAESMQLEHELKLLQRRQQLAQDTLGKYQTLQGNGFLSQAQVQQKQEELLDIGSRLGGLQRAQVQIQARQLALDAEQHHIENNLDSAKLQLQRGLASVKQELAENDQRKVQLVQAKQDGIITTVTSHEGQMLAAGQTLATLIPQALKDSKLSNELEAHLYAPSRTAGFVAKGQTVLIRYSAFPYQKFGLQKGTVIDVSATPFSSNELPPNMASTILSYAQQNVQGFNSNEALYRIKVKLEKQAISTYGQEQALKSGMTLDADIVQDQRKIWEWFTEPLLAAAKRREG
jgi:membrane fusion protein